jgi:hypothetical protein
LHDAWQWEREAGGKVWRTGATGWPGGRVACLKLPEADWRENGILYTSTMIGNLMLSIASSSFDAGRFKGMQVRDRRYPVVDSETGAVMSLVRLGDPMGALSKASRPLDRAGKPRQSPDLMVGASFVSEIFAVSPGKIAYISAYWIPSEGKL